MMLFGYSSFPPLSQILDCGLVIAGAMLERTQGEIDQGRGIRHPAKHALASAYYLDNFEAIPVSFLVPQNLVGRDIEVKNLSRLPPVRARHRHPNQKSRQEEKHYQNG